MNKKILIVDDEENIVELIKFNLELKGYEVYSAYDGMEGLKMAKDIKPSLILLDLMLPILDGTKVCEKIREDEEIKETPIIMLTAKNMEKDKIIGLELGADDYMTKPFSVKELMARIKAVSRRYSSSDKMPEIKIIDEGDLKIDLENYEAFKLDEKIDLTLKEFELLKLLALNKGKVLSRNYLLDKIWGYEYFGETRTVDVHIRHLRKKIEDNDKMPKYIETIRGVGYKLR
ncbi:two-component system alkaline phosphatase synthesis response regulator PhoP [Acetoanaerobium pronyense]|uniref:Stage 0 sporulation protein A homolog n=1 Tax=Acetoanaerobium pronyense TaxID=1482736 RepID=A0ABS4KFY4_9FIRM|nr:response regulator transcription factor [Acetoanaerobium pronyense]MBP2026662.1 two-component system alkaline phosphatase synthesis response regulator PhoP [Acetoanaerobium pronyense]